MVPVTCFVKYLMESVMNQKYTHLQPYTKLIIQPSYFSQSCGAINPFMVKTQQSSMVIDMEARAFWDENELLGPEKKLSASLISRQILLWVKQSYSLIFQRTYRVFASEYSVFDIEPDIKIYHLKHQQCQIQMKSELCGLLSQSEEFIQSTILPLGPCSTARVSI